MMPFSRSGGSQYATMEVLVVSTAVTFRGLDGAI